MGTILNNGVYLRINGICFEHRISGFMIYFLNMCQSNVFLIADLMSQKCFVDEVRISDYNNFNKTNYNGH